LTTSFQNPRFLYLSEWLLWTSVSLFRYILWLYDIKILLLWGAMDGIIMFMYALQLFINNACCHHRRRYARCKPRMSATQVTHCLAILHYKEPEEQLYQLVEDLANQPTDGTKVLILGMERKTDDKEKKVRECEARAKGAFSKILYTVHNLRPGEIPGTCSNHFEVQVAAEMYFEDKTNVIFSKFDCNMRLSGDLLTEIEVLWCSLTPTEQHSVTFMPNVCWSADVPDDQRSLWEIGLAWGMSVSANMAPFSMSFVSGSLAGALEAGYTPPSLLSEDELMFSKKMCILPSAKTYRLSSIIMKIFYPADVDSITFVRSVFLPKVERWYVGWLEVHGYLIKWLLGRLEDHAPIRFRRKAAGVLFLSMLRMYCAFVPPISTVPLAVVNFYCWRKIDEHWVYKPVLRGSLIVFLGYMALNIFMAVRIQIRLYHGFDCLKFRPKTIVAATFCALPLTLLVPVHLLFTYLKHGLLNRPVVHIANTDKLISPPGTPGRYKKNGDGGTPELELQHGGPGSVRLLQKVDAHGGDQEAL
jgi:hypothetical protein